MAWVVDTSILLDIHGNDPAFGEASARCVAQHLPGGLVICPVTYVELAPAFGGNVVLQHRFLQQVGISWKEPWHWRDIQAAHQLWANQVAAKRAGTRAKRVVTDLLIEAFTQRFEGILTRNPKDFTSVPIIAP